MSLAAADLDIMREYAALVNDEGVRRSNFDTIANESALTRVMLERM